MNPTHRLEPLIMDYQCEFQIKDQLWKVVTDHMRPVNAVIGTLLSLGYDDSIVGPVSEQLLADSRLCSPFAKQTPADGSVVCTTRGSLWFPQ
jgi:hypothetical protein